MIEKAQIGKVLDRLSAVEAAMGDSSVMADAKRYRDTVREHTALKKLEMYQADPETAKLPVCIAKTQYSLSHDPKLLGRPRGWRMPVRDVLVYKGAGLLVPVAGEIKLMPGTSASPAYRRIDVDTATGKVRGLF